MKTLSKISIWLILIMNTTLGYSQQNVKTQVIALSTCDSIDGQMLIYNGNENNRITKFETSNQIPTVFKITGINPLRYRYFINNEAITQFMQTNVITLPLNPYVAGSALAVANEINIPEIFKTDSLSSKTRTKIKEYQAINQKYEDSITLIEGELNEIWFGIQSTISDTQMQKKEYWKNLRVVPLIGRVNKNKSFHNANLKEYQIYTDALPINNPMFGMLQFYKDLDTSSSSGVSDIDSIKKYKKWFANDYIKRINEFKKVKKWLFDIETNGKYNQNYNDRNTYDSLMHYINDYSFTWIENVNSSFAPEKTAETKQKNISDLREEILTKQFQMYEEFVLNVATRIGVLVQEQFRTYSSFDNALKSYSFIDSTTLDSVRKQRRKLIAVFEFIQQTNAELQALVPYLDINTELYQSIAKNINNNYIYLLQYLKNLDFIIEENTSQFTLPTHTNLKNIDLIRYTIKREDNITKSTQTYDYDFWLRGGLKIDISFGMFGTRLVDNVYNKVLLETVDDIDKIRITKQESGLADFAFGGMVNVTPRNGANWVNIGGSIGVAYSGNQKLQLLSALSLQFGKTERIMLHAGVAIGTIKYIDVSANNFTFYNKDLKEIAREDLAETKEKDRVYMIQSPDIKFANFTIPTYDKFSVKPFFGVTYNLSKKTALSAVSGGGLEPFKNNLTNGPTY